MVEHGPLLPLPNSGHAPYGICGRGVIRFGSSGKAPNHRERVGGACEESLKARKVTVAPCRLSLCPRIPRTLRPLRSAAIITLESRTIPTLAGSTACGGRQFLLRLFRSLDRGQELYPFLLPCLWPGPRVRRFSRRPCPPAERPPRASRPFPLPTLP